ncbi:polyprenyl synthetase family protein [Streptomyces niger]|uniref:polyprenyl synthetase family protein n=1 Tax=Streptomyces niger TaxID=66373 RepID=UPI0006994C4E|nr:polyprenyl synthetase family protein [Streptomyces niger]
MSALSSMAAAVPAAGEAPGRGAGAGGDGAELFAWARELVTPALRRAVEDLPAPQREIVGYHRGWHGVAGPAAQGGGKAVRPALAFLSAMAVDTPPGSVVPGVVAVELVHDFSLLHDDVIDADPLRRHRPAVWARYGSPAAVLTGDALLVRALAVLAADARPYSAPATGELSRMLADLLRGQSQDVAFESTARVRPEEYLEMAAGKTGALMACACALGALHAAGQGGERGGPRAERALVAPAVVEGEAPVHPQRRPQQSVVGGGIGGEPGEEVGAAGGNGPGPLLVGRAHRAAPDPLLGPFVDEVSTRVPGRLQGAEVWREIDLVDGHCHERHL